MHDPVEIRHRIEQVARRVARRSDYATLLGWGEVARSFESAEEGLAWRDAIKHEARADRFRVRTGSEGTIVWAALLTRRVLDVVTEQRMERLLSGAVPLAVRSGHEPMLAVRDDAEMVTRCGRCGAEGYVCAGDGVVGGELFDDVCPFDDPPRTTLLANLYGPHPRRPLT